MINKNTKNKELNISRNSSQSSSNNKAFDIYKASNAKNKNVIIQENENKKEKKNENETVSVLFFYYLIINPAL